MRFIILLLLAAATCAAAEDQERAAADSLRKEIKAAYDRYATKVLPIATAIKKVEVRALPADPRKSDIADHERAIQDNEAIASFQNALQVAQKNEAAGNGAENEVAMQMLIFFNERKRLEDREKHARQEEENRAKSSAIRPAR